MRNKIILICVLAISFCMVTGVYLLFNNKTSEIPVETTKTVEPQQPKTEGIKKTYTKPIQKETKKEILYTPQNALLSLYAVSEISKLPKEIQEKINNIEKNNVILSVLKNDKEHFVLISENPNNYQGHEIEIVNINKNNGEVETKQVLQNPNISNNDEWEYDELTKNPLKHVNKDDEGNLIYTEVWFYDDSNPIKYEKKNADDKIIAVKKETIDSETKYRSEHIIYDSEGNINKNISMRYDGNELVGFTYYDSDHPNNGQTVIGELDENGQKSAEIVYSSDYKFKNKYSAEYKNGIIESIKVYNNKDKELQNNKN